MTEMMKTFHLTFGTPVYCIDKVCGTLAYVAVDPVTRHVTDIVVEHGLPFFKHNRVVPFAAIRRVTAAAIDLTITNTEWEGYQEYHEIDLEEPDPIGSPGAGRIGSDGILTYALPTIHRRLRQGIADGRALLHAHTPIHDGDSTVGQVDHVLATQPVGQLTHIALRRGIFQREYIVVPIDRFIIDSDGLQLLSAAVVELAGLPHYQRPGEDALLMEVEQHLHEESAAFARVHASMKEGVLHLSGHVISRELKHHASELARTISGVQHVQNDLQIGMNDAPAQIGVVTDEIAAAVSYALAADERMHGSAIEVTHTDGTIYLRGSVPGIVEFRLAGNLAATQPGVKAVCNELTVQAARQPATAW